MYMHVYSCLHDIVFVILFLAPDKILINVQGAVPIQKRFLLHLHFFNKGKKIKTS
jgi:hypothetical protein